MGEYRPKCSRIASRIPLISTSDRRITMLSRVLELQVFQKTPTFTTPDDMEVADLRQFLLTPLPGDRGPER